MDSRLHLSGLSLRLLARLRRVKIAYFKVGGVNGSTSVSKTERMGSSPIRLVSTTRDVGVNVGKQIMLRDGRCCGAIRKRLFRRWLSCGVETVARTDFCRPRRCRLNLEWVCPAKFGESSLVTDDRSCVERS